VASWLFRVCTRISPRIFWKMQYVAVWCSALQNVAVCCSVCCSMLQCELQYVAVCVAVWCAVCCNLLRVSPIPRNSEKVQCVAVCCSVLQCVAECCSKVSSLYNLPGEKKLTALLTFENPYLYFSKVALLSNFIVNWVAGWFFQFFLFYAQFLSFPECSSLPAGIWVQSRKKCFWNFSKLSSPHNLQ